MKFLYFGDLHINGKEDRADLYMQVLRDVFFEAVESKVDYILFGGDFFDNATQNKNRLVCKAIEVFSGLISASKSLKGFIAITGNHDHVGDYSLASPCDSLLHSFRNINEEKVHIIQPKLTDGDFTGYRKEIKTDKGQVISIYGLPFFRKKKAYEEAFCLLLEKAHQEKSECRILLIHQTPKGAMPEFVPHDIDPNDERYGIFDMVFCGHIHKQRKYLPNFLQAGCPIQHSFSDVGEKTSAWLYDTKDKTLLFVPLGDYPKHYYVPDGEETQAGKKDIVRKVYGGVSGEGGEKGDTYTLNLGANELVEKYFAQLSPEERPKDEEKAKHQICKFLNMGGILLPSQTKSQ